MGDGRLRAGDTARGRAESSFGGGQGNATPGGFRRCCSRSCHRERCHRNWGGNSASSDLRVSTSEIGGRTDQWATQVQSAVSFAVRRRDLDQMPVRPSQRRSGYTRAQGAKFKRVVVFTARCRREFQVEGRDSSGQGGGLWQLLFTRGVA